MEEAFDRQMELLFSFYEKLHRKGPGSEASTCKALSMLRDVPANPDVIDFGCGSGAASLVLARATGGRMTAVDVHGPFLDDLDARAADASVAERIKTVRADMADPPFPDESFDLVWSEGAIYLIGFEAGLKRWRRLLRPGGYVAVTEATWLCADPPAEAAAFWSVGYPAMTTIERNLAMVRSAGFEPVDHFVLPSTDWTAYYEPLEDQLLLFRQQHAQDEEAHAFAENTQQEIDLWKQCGDSYGYVFYLARACWHPRKKG